MVDVDKCEHNNCALAYYPEKDGTHRVQSLYTVYCLNCRKFINLLSGKEVFDDELHHEVKYNG